MAITLKGPIKKVIKGLQGIFLLLCLGYLGFAFYQDGDTMVELFSRANLLLFIPALLLWPACILFSGVFAWQLLASLEHNIPYRKVVAIYLVRIPAKYLPGGIWQTVARAYDLNRLGIPKTDIGILVFYENFWTVFIAALVSCSLLLLRDGEGIYQEIALLILAGTVILVPFILVFRRQSFILPPSGYLRITLTGIVFWLFAITCFLLYISAFGDMMTGIRIIDIAVNYLFSYVIGFVSIFTPQGIGVFELVMTQLTEFQLSVNQAIILLAGFRVVVLLGDMITWLIYLVLNRRYRFQE